MLSNNKLILQTVNSKDKDAWHVLFDYYYPSLCAYVERFLHGEDESKDIVQEVFIGLWKSNQEFDTIKNLNYYLYRSCYNRALNYIRNQKVSDKKFEPINDYHSFESDEVYDETLESEVVRRLYQHINDLPNQQKQILLLKLKGYSWVEIAEDLDISINTVKTYRARAFKVLSEKMNVSELFVAVLMFSIEMFRA